MLYILLKIIFKIALRVFFQRIEVRNQHLIPATGPLLIAANHPNTFMDPIAIAAVVKQEVFFIAKGTVFNSPLKRWLLHKMNLIPVYRREDGAVPAADNEATFQKCTAFLQQKGTLLIFPEGNSYNERRLRPLKTGTARIALAAESQFNGEMNVQILPVGVNYTDPTRFRSKLFINIGAPIAVKDFIIPADPDNFKVAQELTGEISRRLTDLLIITESEEEDELVQQVERVYWADLRQDFNLQARQEDNFVLTKGIAESIRYFQKSEPERVQVLREKLNLYHQNLKRLGLQDKYLAQSQSKPNIFEDSLKTIFYLIAGFPLFVWGLITNYLPYYIPGKIADVLTDAEEFRAPVMMTAGIFTFGLTYALIIAVAYTGTNSVLLTLAILLSLPLSGFFVLRYSYRLRVTQTYIRLIAFLFERSPALSSLLQQREEILRSLEEAKHIYLQHTGLIKGPAPLNEM